ncbi:hypothetical protein I3842_01G172700 [Carya illinoinensis]|nr:hypothetical protein I3842_01G172700 [Carya illinoinensis]
MSVSKVWNYFSKVEIDGETKAVCNYCNRKLVGSSKKGTSHLNNHLLRCPVMKNVETQKKEMSTCPETAGIGGDFLFDNERSCLDLARMITRQRCPLDMVEHESFQTFVKNLQPRFTLPSQDTLKADILHVYREEKLKLHEYLGKLSCHFSLIMQFWTCHRMKNVYCCFAVQFLEDGVTLKKILALQKVDHSDYHQGTLLFERVKSLLEEWNIDKKLCSITLRSSASNDKMVQSLKSLLSQRTNCQMPLFEHFFHIHCITYIINLPLQDGLNEMAGLLDKIRNTIRYINEASPRWELKFQHILEQHNFRDKYSTIFEYVSTRWDSTFLLFESAMELRELFSHLDTTDCSFMDLNPHEDEWIMAAIVYKTLKYTYDSICSVLGCKCLTANVYFNKVCDIYSMLLELQNNSHKFVRLMAAKMKEKFESYFGKCRMVLAIAAILDPRLKLEFVQSAFEVLVGDDQARIIVADIRNILNDVFDSYAAEPGVQVQELSSSFSTSHMINQWRQSKRHKSAASPRAELNRYLQEDVINNAEEDFDILGWWRTNSSDFPTVGKMALNILSIPMSTCTISNSGFNNRTMMMINPTLDSLNLEIIEALVCGEHWLGDEHSSIYSLNAEPTDQEKLDPFSIYNIIRESRDRHLYIRACQALGTQFGSNNLMESSLACGESGSSIKK